MQGKVKCMSEIMANRYSQNGVLHTPKHNEEPQKQQEPIQESLGVKSSAKKF